MSSDDKRLFQMALSYRQKAASLRETRAGRRHLRAAQSVLKSLRGLQCDRLRTIERQIRREGNAQLELSRLLSTGRMTAGKANEASRRIAAQIAQLHDEAASRRLLVQAEFPEAVGGFVDKPLDAYGEDFSEAVYSASTFIAWVLIAMPAAMAASVLLPWPLPSHGLFSLLALPRLFVDPFAPDSTATAPLLSILGLPYASLPLLALAALRYPAARYMGWGLLLLGATLAWMSCLPVGAAVLHAPSMQDHAALWRLIGLGPIVYCAGGISIALVGAQRIRSMQDVVHTTLIGAAVLTAWVAAIFAIPLVPMLLPASPNDPEIAASLRDPASGVIYVEILNNDRRAITLRTATANERGAPGMIDAQVWVSELDSQDFIRVSDPSACWISAGNAAIAPLSSIVIAPHATQRLVFDARRLLENGLNPVRVRLAFTHASGREFAAFEASLPVRLTAIPDAAEKTREQGRVRTPPPMPPLKSPAEALPVPIAAGPVSSARTDEALPQIVVHYAGRVGDRVSLTVTVHPEARPKQILAAAGDAIEQGWIIAEIRNRPAEVIFVHQTTQKTVSLARNQTISLPLR